jgi:nucleoid DNA-binding protein
MSALIGPALLQRLVAERTGTELCDVEKVLEAYEHIVIDLLQSGARVRAFDGILAVVETKATRRKAPGTNQVIEVPARRKIVFKVPRKR